MLGGKVCMWGETADASNVQQTIWPRAGAAAGEQDILISGHLLPAESLWVFQKTLHLI
ncbi:hypothetical protein ACS0TY_021077 [Phlomoides rotata]